MLGGDGSKVEDAVVVLKAPKLEGGNLTFDVSVLEGSLSGSSGPAALFIDRGGDFGGGGLGGRDFGGGDFDRNRGDFAGSYGRVGDTAVYHNDRTGNTYAWHGGNYWHAPVYHGAWYAGAPVAAGVAVGAAIAHPYWSGYYNRGYRCGYYPYPPCE
jgi:hypothetical protein